MSNASSVRQPSTAVADLPASGYPISEDAVDHWFRKRHGRAPSEEELGTIIGQMAQRDATSPRSGPTPVAEGWVTGPSAPAAKRG